MSTFRADPDLPPNHHHDFPEFGGVLGLVAALRFLIGRTSDADLAVALTGVGPGDDVVDIGCGPGVAARRVVPLAASVTAVDPAAVMVRVGRAVTPRRASVHYRQGAAERLPLADGSASVVWSVATVHHWRDLGAGLREVRRVLRPAGRFLALERRVGAGATGHASHGWTEDQADLFAEHCRGAGFSGVEVGRHADGGRTVLSVLATAT